MTDDVDETKLDYLCRCLHEMDEHERGMRLDSHTKRNMFLHVLPDLNIYGI